MKVLILLICFLSFFIIDITVDLRQGVAFNHILHEVILVLVAFGGVLWQLKVIIEKNRHIRTLHSELLETKNEYKAWREKSQAKAQEMRQLIDQQFSLWQLSDSEKDVALLLIKGLSMKEIAEIRNTTEKTVRHQATNVYKKSELSGRQELEAFFLEDILSAPLSSL